MLCTEASMSAEGVLSGVPCNCSPESFHFCGSFVHGIREGQPLSTEGQHTRSPFVLVDRRLAWAGLAISTYDGSQQLKDFFVVTSLSSDKKGFEYISTMEARKVKITPYTLLQLLSLLFSLWDHVLQSCMQTCKKHAIGMKLAQFLLQVY